MRIKNTLALATALIVIGTSMSIARPAWADDAPLSGNWKLVVLPFGDDDFAIFNLSPKNGKTTATVVDAQQMLRKPKVGAVEEKNGSFTISLAGAGLVTSFKGTRTKTDRAQGNSWARSTSGVRRTPHAWSLPKNRRWARSSKAR